MNITLITTTTSTCSINLHRDIDCSQCQNSALLSGNQVRKYAMIMSSEKYSNTLELLDSIHKFFQVYHRINVQELADFLFESEIDKIIPEINYYLMNLNINYLEPSISLIEILKQLFRLNREFQEKAKSKIPTESNIIKDGHFFDENFIFRGTACGVCPICSAEVRNNFKLFEREIPIPHENCEWDYFSEFITISCAVADKKRMICCSVEFDADVVFDYVPNIFFLKLNRTCEIDGLRILSRAKVNIPLILDCFCKACYNYDTARERFHLIGIIAKKSNDDEGDYMDTTHISYLREISVDKFNCSAHNCCSYILETDANNKANKSQNVETKPEVSFKYYIDGIEKGHINELDLIEKLNGTHDEQAQLLIYNKIPLHQVCH